MESKTLLTDLLNEGFGIKEDLNCAETILYGANIAYNLGLEKDALKLAAGFGGGMGIGEMCGALTGSVMVLGEMFVSDRAHESLRIKKLAKEFLNEYEKEMGTFICKQLIPKYATKEHKCRVVILKAGEILDRIVARELSTEPV